VRSSTLSCAWLVLRPAKQHRAVLSCAVWLLRRSTRKRARRGDAAPGRKKYVVLALSPVCPPQGAIPFFEYRGFSASYFLVYARHSRL
jgi:hypothetical protein